MSAHALNIAIAPYAAVLHFTTGRKDFKSVVKQLGWKKAKGLKGNAGICLRKGEDGATYVIGVFDGRLSTLVHELTHLCMFEAERTQFHTDNRNDEAFAYLIGYLVDECLKGIRNRKYRLLT